MQGGRGVTQIRSRTPRPQRGAALLLQVLMHCACTTSTPKLIRSAEEPERLNEKVACCMRVCLVAGQSAANQERGSFLPSCRQAGLRAPAHHAAVAWQLRLLLQRVSRAPLSRHVPQADAIVATCGHAGMGGSSSQ